jgi:autotransporter-associated beta strand protein
MKLPTSIIACLAALIAIMPMASYAANISFNGTANNLTTGAAWVGGVAPGSGDIATWDANAIANLSQALGADTNWLGIAVTSPSGNVSIPSGNTLTLGASGIDMSAATVNFSIAGNLSNSVAQNWNVASGHTLTVTANLLMPAANTITVNGAGTVVLNNGSTYAADPFSGAGTITITGGNSPTYKGGQWNTSGRLNITTTSGSKVAFNNAVTVGSICVTNSATLYPSATGPFTVSGNGSILGGNGNTESRGAIRAECPVIINGTVLLADDNAGRGVSIGGNSGSGSRIYFNGVIDDGNPGGAGYGFSKAPSENGVSFQLGAANTYHGITRWNSGTLILTNQNALQNSTLYFTGGTLTFDSANAANAFTLGGLAGSAAIALQNSASTAIALSIGNNNGTTNFTGILSGPGSIVKVGTGAQTNSAANTYTGNTTINGGKLVVGSDGASGSAAQLGTVPSSATAGSLVINGGTLSASAGFALNANRGIALGPTVGSGNGTIEVPGATTLTYGGIAANNGGTGGLVKSGPGILSLGGANTYTGNTTISNGTLALSSGGSLSSSSSLTINAGGTFDVSALSSPYSVGGSTFTNSGAAAAATIVGASGGTVSVGSPVAVTLNYDGADAALTVSQGTLALNGNVITVNSASQLGIGVYTLIQASGSGSVTTNGNETVVGNALGAPNTVASLAVVSGSLQLKIASSIFVYSAWKITGGSSLTAGGSELITITAVDGSGNPVTSVTGAFSPTFRGLGTAPNGTVPTINGVPEGHPTALTFASGVATATLAVTKAEGPVTLNVTEGFHDSTSPGGSGLTLNVSVGSATYLAMPTHPSSTATAGVVLGSQPVITIVDAYGNLINSSANVTVTASPGTVQGTSTVAASSGTAPFSGLSLNTQGAITLTFASSGLASTNATVVVTAAAPTQLGVLVQPSTVFAGVVFVTQPVVAVEDAYGNVVSNSTLVITVTNAGGTGNLLGMTTTNAVAGLARFSGLYLTNAGITTLTFTNIDLSASVNAIITVNGGYVTGLAWSAQPGSAVAGTPFGTQPVLKTVDQYGNPSTTRLSAYQNVAVTLGGSGTLSGTTNVNIGTAGGNGVINFSNLKIDTAGTNTLQASASGIISNNPAIFSDITNCVLWLDAGDIGTLTFSGSTVTAWADKSGTTNNATGGSSPTFATNSMLAANGSGFGQAVRFSAGGFGSGVSFASLSNSPYSMLVMEVGSGSATVNQSRYFFGNAGSQTDQVLSFGYQDSGQFRWQQFGDDLNYPGSDTAGTYSTVTPRQWSGVIDATRSRSLYSNSVSLVTGNVAGSFLKGTTLSQGSVGGGNGVGNYVGDMAEILVYNKALSTAERGALETYLNTKWLGSATPAIATTTSFVVATNQPPVANIVTNNVTSGETWKIAISDLKTAAGWSDPDGDTVTFNGVNSPSTKGTNMTSDSSYIYYNGPVTSEDHFTYTITDGTLTGTGTVYLEAVAATAPRISNPATDGNGHPTFSGNGISGYTYGVESATSLSGPWFNAGTVTAGANGSWSFTDASQSNPPIIFYRLYYPYSAGSPPQ